MLSPLFLPAFVILNGLSSQLTPGPELGEGYPDWAFHVSGESPASRLSEQQFPFCLFSGRKWSPHSKGSWLKEQFEIISEHGEDPFSSLKYL